MNQKQNYLMVYIKTSHICNLNCQYCYDMPDRIKYGKQILDLNQLSKLNKLLNDNYNNISYMWHGGEPTCVPLSYYEKTQEIFKNNTSNTTQDVITNATLFNKDWVKFTKDNNIAIAFSYDGEVSLRNGHAKFNILDNFKKCQEYDKDYGITIVVNKENINNLIDLYNNFLSIGANPIVFNPIFSFTKGDNDFLINKSDFVREYRKFLNYIINNKDIPVEMSLFKFIHYLFNQIPPSCRYIDCRQSSLSINPNGSLFPCGGCFPDKYNMGKISDYENIQEVFNSKGYKIYSEEIEEKLESYCYKCDYYFLCKGGCHNSSMYKYGSVNLLDEQDCVNFKALLESSYLALRDINNIENIQQEDFKGYFENEFAFLPCEYIPLIEKQIKRKIEYIPAEEIISQNDILINSEEFKFFKLINYELNNLKIQNETVEYIKKIKPDFEFNKENKKIYLKFLIKNNRDKIK